MDNFILNHTDSKSKELNKIHTCGEIEALYVWNLYCFNFYGNIMKEMNYLVYKHTNKENGKCYIGITKDTKDRWVAKGYKYQGSPYFYKAIKKYGWDNFDHEILIEGLTEKEARKKETEYIKLYHSNDDRFGYNLTEGGEHNIPNQSVKDKISKTQKALMTEEKRQLLREKALQNDYSGERNPFYGQKHAVETRERMSRNQWAKKDKKRFLEVVKKNINIGGDESRFAKRIVRINDSKEYPSITRCAEDNDVHVCTIKNHCKGNLTYAEFMYFDDYQKLSEEEMQKLKTLLIDKKQNPDKYKINTKAVVCMSDRQVFVSIKVCHDKTGKDYKTIINHCKCKDTLGKPLKTPQKFMYLPDYIAKYGDTNLKYNNSGE